VRQQAFAGIGTGIKITAGEENIIADTLNRLTILCISFVAKHYDSSL